MNIEEFRKTREFSPDLRIKFPEEFDQWHFEGGAPVMGFVYEGRWWIQILNGTFYTVLGNFDPSSVCLDEMEKLLFEYTRGL
jgi:hypothetical protein